MSSESQLPGFSDFASKVGRSPSLWPPGKAELGPGCMVESWGGGGALLSSGVTLGKSPDLSKP